MTNSGNLISTDVTAVTPNSNNAPNDCIDYVSIGNTQELTEEKTAVLPEVTELPESEWMSEENLQLMAADERMLRGY